MPDLRKLHSLVISWMEEEAAELKWTIKEAMNHGYQILSWSDAGNPFIDKVAILNKSDVLFFAFIAKMKLSFNEKEDVETLFIINSLNQSATDLKIYRKEKHLLRVLAHSRAEKNEKGFIFNQGSYAEVHMHLDKKEQPGALTVLDRFMQPLAFIHLNDSAPKKKDLKEHVIESLGDASAQIRATINAESVGIDETFTEMILDPASLKKIANHTTCDPNFGVLIPLKGEGDSHLTGTSVAIVTHDLGIGIPIKRILIIGDLYKKNRGAIIPETCAKINAALHLAEKLKIPIDWFPASFGTEISLERGVEGLAASASTARLISCLCKNAKIPINIIINQTTIGAQSYWNAISTMLQETKGILIMTKAGSMALTGPRALVAAMQTNLSGMEIQKAAKRIYPNGLDDLGSFESIYGPNGEAVYGCKTIAEACNFLMRHHYFSYSSTTQTLVSERLCVQHHDSSLPKKDFLVSFEEIKKIQQGKRGNKELILHYLQDLRAPAFNPFWKEHCYLGKLTSKNGEGMQNPTALIQEMQIHGVPCMVILTPTGPLTPLDARLVSKAFWKADDRMPVVILGNLSGFSSDPLSMKNHQLESGSLIVEAIVHHKGPILVVNLGGLIGGTFVVFSKELNCNLNIFALEGAKVQVIGGKSASKVVFHSAIIKKVKEDPRYLELLNKSSKESIDAQFKLLIHEYEKRIQEEYDEKHSIERALKLGAIDKIITVEKLREEMGSWLKHVCQKSFEQAAA